MSVGEKMTAIASAIRDKTGSTAPLTLDGMAAAVPQVFEAGKQAREDAFWEHYQQNGTRTDYQGAFAGVGWTNESFHPKYDLAPTGTGAVYMFRVSGISGDLAELLDGLGVALDFSGCTNLNEVFSNASSITRIGVLDLSKATIATNAFAYSGVKTIDKVIVSPGFNPAYFPGAALQLEHMPLEGTVAKSGFNAQYCTKLDKESITSIINALSATTSGLSITLSKTAVDNAFSNDGESVGTNTGEWNELIGTKSNWTINLI